MPLRSKATYSNFSQHDAVNLVSHFIKVYYKAPICIFFFYNTLGLNLSFATSCLLKLSFYSQISHLGYKNTFYSKKN